MDVPRSAADEVVSPDFGSFFIRFGAAVIVDDALVPRPPSLAPRLSTCKLSAWSKTTQVTC